MNLWITLAAAAFAACASLLLAGMVILGPGGKAQQEARDQSEAALAR